jgi:hypothetical protein
VSTISALAAEGDIININKPASKPRDVRKATSELIRLIDWSRTLLQRDKGRMNGG